MKSIYHRSATRRDVLKIAAAVSLPIFLPSRVFGEDAPSKKINVASIGVGWQGGYNLDRFLEIGDCRVVAIADLDEGHRQGAVNKVNGHYKDENCKGYKDFREVIARADIDLVAISTPDHWHSIPAIMAAQAGKDIFCEKPLSHTLAEGIAMVDAVTKAKRIWQTGSWQRSNEEFRWAVELVLSGFIGKVSRVEVGLPGGHTDFGGSGANAPDSEAPAHVDYDFWLGPAAKMPFNRSRFHKNWRWNYNTGGGQLMDWIGHHCDIAHWGLSNKHGCGITDDQLGPMEIKATAEFPNKTDIWNTATKYRIDCKYPNNVEVIIAAGEKEIRDGTRWIGANGWVQVSRGRIETSNREWMKELKEREDKLPVVIPKSPGHWRELIDCVKSRKRTLTPVEVAHRSQTPGHLGLIAARTGRTLKWDAKKQVILGDAEASKMIGKDFRAPWKL